MLCPKCGAYATAEDILCPQCQTLLTHDEGSGGGVQSIRQGRTGSRSTPARPVSPAPAPVPRRGASRTYVDASARSSSTNIPLYADPEIYDENGDRMGTEKIRSLREVNNSLAAEGLLPGSERVRHRRAKKKRFSGVNWAYVTIALVILLLLGAFGMYMYLDKTPGGQLILARMGVDAEAAALWQVGEERLDTGDIDGAVEYFLLAREKDGKDNINVTGLMSLCSAYEADGRLEEAEALYTEIYTEIAPSAPEAYRSMVRILLSQRRDPEAAELLKLAYEKTGQETFLQQRSELLPSIPTVDLIGGYYNQKKSLNLSSAESYEIYFTFDPEAVLPEGGTLYTGTIPLHEEGEHVLRAVAVSETLVSDPLQVTYQIFMPTPLQPQANLAPNTYQKSQTVRLTPGKLTDEELEKNPGYKSTLTDPVAQDIVIYYTIDGSAPDSDSPIFDGTPIKLPARKITLRAVSVNGYGKPSNTKEITYKIMAEPWPEAPFEMADAIGGMKLTATTREEFFLQHGEGERSEAVTSSLLQHECMRYYYPWGYVTMIHNSAGWVLGDLYFTSSYFSGPRGTGIGSMESEITSKFKDMGQVASASGNRGLYEDDDDKGKIYLQEDGTKIIRYIASTGDGHRWQLEYTLNTSGACTAILWTYLH